MVELVVATYCTGYTADFGSVTLKCLCCWFPFSWKQQYTALITQLFLVEVEIVTLCALVTLLLLVLLEVEHIVLFTDV